MRVEVTEQNIIIFGLVQLTGNSSEVLMERAREAEKSGYILSVEVPDTDDIDVNLFDLGRSQEVNPDLTHDGRSPYGTDVVTGEVVERKDNEQ